MTTPENPEQWDEIDEIAARLSAELTERPAAEIRLPQIDFRLPSGNVRLPSSSDIRLPQVDAEAFRRITRVGRQLGRQASLAETEKPST